MRNRSHTSFRLDHSLPWRWAAALTLRTLAVVDLMSDIGVFSMMISQLLELIARQSSLLFFAPQQSMYWIMKISRLNGNQALAETLGKQSQWGLRKFLPPGVILRNAGKTFPAVTVPCKSAVSAYGMGLQDVCEKPAFACQYAHFVGD